MRSNIILYRYLVLSTSTHSVSHFIHRKIMSRNTKDLSFLETLGTFDSTLLENRVGPLLLS